jgi:hypothetical protein
MKEQIGLMKKKQVEWVNDFLPKLISLKNNKIKF